MNKRNVLLLGVLVFALSTVIYLKFNSSSPPGPSEIQEKIEDGAQLPPSAGNKLSPTNQNSEQSRVKFTIGPDIRERLDDARQALLNQNSDQKDRRYFTRRTTLSASSTDRIQPNSLRGLEKLKKTLELAGKEDQLKLSSSLPAGASGTQVWRYTPQHKGLPVFGTEVVFNLTHAGDKVTEEIIADYIKRFPSNLTTKPDISIQEAIALATSDVRTSFGSETLTPKVSSSTLGYFPMNGTIKLSWSLVLKTPFYQSNEGVRPAGSWNYLVDALENTVLQKTNRNRSVEQASGPGSLRGVSTNISGLDVTAVVGTTLYQADTERLATFDWQGSFNSRSIVRGPLNSFGVAEGNNVHQFTEQALDMLKNDFGFRSINEDGFKLLSNVNFGVGYENAFWSYEDQQMFYGDGGGTYFPFSSDPSVAFHELHHGFTQFHAYLDGNTQSLALDEAFADIGAIHTKWYLNPATANFLMGDHVYRRRADPRDEFLRDLCTPTNDNILVMIIPGSIQHMASYPQLFRDAEMLTDNDIDLNDIVSHYANGIPNRAFCRLAKRFSSSGNPEGVATRQGVKKAAKLFMFANRNKWTRGETLYSSNRGTFSVARDLTSEYSNADLDLITKSWQDVGVLPPDPTLLAPTVTSENSVRLSWNSNNSLVSPSVITLYAIFIKRPNQDYQLLTTATGDSTTSEVSGLAVGQPHSFLLLAVNEGGVSLFSNEVTVTPFLQAPAAPSALGATTNSSSQITLTWADNSQNESNFVLERKTGANGIYAVVATLPQDSVSFANTGLTPNTNYFYRIQAKNNAGKSNYSNEVSASTPEVPPAAPSSLGATVLSSTSIKLTWVDNSKNETNFVIERKIGAGGTYTALPTAAQNSVLFNDTGLSPNTTYFYRIRATNNGGNSNYSNVASATTPNVAPAAPTSLAATTLSSTSIKLTWMDNSNNEQGFKIERSTKATTSFVQIGTVGAGITTFTNTLLTKNTRYYYRVRSYNTVGNSGYSNTANTLTGR